MSRNYLTQGGTVPPVSARPQDVKASDKIKGMVHIIWKVKAVPGDLLDF